MNRSFKYRLYTTASQNAALDEMLGAFCDLYNAGLQQRIEAYRRKGIGLRYTDQSAELKAVRAADERLSRYSFSAEQQVLRRLEKTFSAFFGRIKRGTSGGFPRFQGKNRFNSAEFRVRDGLTIRKSQKIGIVGIPGEIKVRWHRAIPDGAKVGAAVITRKAGRWFICFQVEIPDAEPAERTFAPVGIDMGLASLVALSTGETVPTPQFTRRAAKALRKAERAVSRKRRHSKRQRKAKLRVARLHCRIANQRRDFLHKVSRRLVCAHSHIALEELNISSLAAGRFAKAVHNAAWAQFVRHVQYKAEGAGTVVAFVNPRGTSQTCPECGAIARKTIAVREHRCECGCVIDRDVAAARVILLRAGFKPGHGFQAPSQRSTA